MPFRSVVPSAALRLQRQFHASAIRGVDSPSHYDTLQVPANATAKDIKKSFYSLSKTHHPDHNPDDPQAAERFVKISEAYHVLGTPEKRLRYDRDVMRTSPSGSHSHPAHGSYHSSNPAGGRAPSGLSRRRTHFHGPPPSFYRSGGWGTQGAKRSEAQQNSTSGASAAGEGMHHGSPGGGMGHGQNPFGHTTEVPHFDREGHFRTHTNHERRQRQRRMSESFIPLEPGPSTLSNFLFVTGIVSLGILIPSFIFERLRRDKKDKE